jgi:hypothetical protein
VTSKLLPLLSLADLEHGPGAGLLETTIAQGFSPAVARAGLQAEFDAWQMPGAVAAVLGELPDSLDPKRKPATVLVIAARTLPASALRAVLMARLLGARVLLKPASGQPSLAMAMADADPGVTALPFGSEDRVALDAAIAQADAVVVLGSDAAVASVRQATPRSKPCVGYGHRVSAAWLETPDDAALLGLAEDLCAWDQAGCLSPQVLWTNEPASVGPRLAEALRTVERRMPMTLPPDATHARMTARTRAEMLGNVWTTETAIVAALTDPCFRPSPGYRFLWVLPADEAARTAATPILSTVATDAPLALPEGIRQCRPGQMQRPPLTWRHDGEANLLPMLRGKR